MLRERRRQYADDARSELWLVVASVGEVQCSLENAMADLLVFCSLLLCLVDLAAVYVYRSTPRMAYSGSFFAIVGHRGVCVSTDGVGIEMHWGDASKATRTQIVSGSGFEEIGFYYHYLEFEGGYGVCLINFPHWFIIITMMLPILWWWRRYRKRKRLRLMIGKVCLDCGYDLRHSQARCPECGAPIPAVSCPVP